MTYNTTKLCETAEDVLTDAYKGIVAAEILTAILAISPNILLLSALKKVTVFPTNLRLLIGHLSFVLLLFCAFTVVKGIYILVTPTCDFSISLRWCKIAEMLGTSLALPNIFYSLPTICLERLYATINYRKYDKNQKPYLAIFLIVISWVVAFSLNRGTAMFTWPNDEYVPFCDLTFFPSGNSVHFPIYVIVEIITIIICLSVHYYNKYIAGNMAINRAKYDLSSRFLVDQNVQISKILLPSMALHFISHLPTYIVLSMNYYPLISVAFSIPTRTWFLQSTFLWRLFYATADPIIAFRFNVHLRQHLTQGPFGRAMKRFGIDMIEIKIGDNVFAQEKMHFDYLNKAWAPPTKGRGVRSNQIKPINLDITGI